MNSLVMPPQVDSARMVARLAAGLDSAPAQFGALAPGLVGGARQRQASTALPAATAACDGWCTASASQAEIATDEGDWNRATAGNRMSDPGGGKVAHNILGAGNSGDSNLGSGNIEAAEPNLATRVPRIPASRSMPLNGLAPPSVIAAVQELSGIPAPAISANKISPTNTLALIRHGPWERRYRRGAVLTHAARIRGDSIRILDVCITYAPTAVMHQLQSRSYRFT
jgi:hypothetical protein